MNKVLFSLIFFTAIVGCAQPIPRDRYFRLDDPAPQSTRATPTISAVLEVGPLDARGMLKVERYILQSTDAAGAEITWDEHALWTDPPARMVEKALLYYLRESGLFEQAIEREGQAAARYRLSGELIALERQSTGAAVLLTADLNLLDLRSRSVALAKRYHIAEATTDTSIDGAIEGFNRAVVRLAQDFAADIETLDL